MRAEDQVFLRPEARVFLAYAGSFLSGDAARDKHARLKTAHSLRVLRNARRIAAEEISPRRGQARRGLLLAALYHDLGRFEQLKRYNTFVDALSINHGMLGARLLGLPQFLAGENAAMRKLTRAAVMLHNRPCLPPSLPDPLDIVSRALRDADKLDIIRVLKEEFQPGRAPDETVALRLSPDPDLYNPAILEALLTGRAILYKDMTSINDFRLLLCGWACGLEFKASRRLLARSGYMEDVLAGLPAKRELDAARVLARNALAL